MKLLYNKDLIVKELGLVRFGQKNWMKAKGLSCPHCGKDDKFGILISSQTKAIVHCFYGCPIESLRDYLKRIGRIDLLQYEEDIDIRQKLEDLIKEEEELDLTMEEKKLPIGYKRIYDSEYLNNRGFKKEDYSFYEVGETKIDPRFKGYIIFPLRRKGVCVGFIARSKHNKKWHDDNLKLAKQGKTQLVLRYNNSLNTEFSKFLYGEEEITENTRTVIITEGIMSKKAVDDKLYLRESDEIKCCATFGQNVSPFHEKILEGVENLILLYDNGTIQSTKNISTKLMLNFNVKIGYIKQEGKDPDDISQEELLEVMSDLRHPLDFYKGKIQNKLKI